jgi:hypothetical protein
MSEDLARDDVAAMRRDADLTAYIKHHMAAARVENARRRGLVIRHPDLAARLTEKPFRFSKPEFWTGFVPPAHWGQSLNNDPTRPILLELIAEAERRQARPAPARTAFEEEAA